MTKYQFAIFLYGLFCLALGIEAYSVKHHLPSLLGGGGIGIIEIMLAVYTYKNPRVGFIGAAVLGVLTGLMFLGQSVQAGAVKFYPAMVMIIVSFAFVYFLMSGHMSARKNKKAQPTQG